MAKTTTNFFLHIVWGVITLILFLFGLTFGLAVEKKERPNTTDVLTAIQGLNQATQESIDELSRGPKKTDLGEDYAYCKEWGFELQMCVKFLVKESDIHKACTGSILMDGGGTDEDLNPRCYPYMGEIIELRQQYSCETVWPYASECEKYRKATQ